MLTREEIRRILTRCIDWETKCSRPCFGIPDMVDEIVEAQKKKAEGNPGPVGTTNDADDWRAVEPVMSDE